MNVYHQGWAQKIMKGMHYCMKTGTFALNISAINNNLSLSIQLKSIIAFNPKVSEQLKTFESITL